MSILAPWTFFFAPQPCQDCTQVRPIAELAPILAENGNWAGFRCARPTVADHVREVLF